MVAVVTLTVLDGLHRRQQLSVTVNELPKCDRLQPTPQTA